MIIQKGIRHEGSLNQVAEEIKKANPNHKKPTAGVISANFTALYHLLIG